jgi:hypothetical protein
MSDKVCNETQDTQEVVSIKTLNENDSFAKLTIPPYQRPYAWGEEQVIQLLEDLIEAWQKDDGRCYLVGNIILHKDNGEDNVKLNIVDGQQRLTTFALILNALDKCCKNENNESCNLGKLNIKLHSYKRMRENYEIIKNRLEKLRSKKDEFINFFLDRTIVTITYADSLDEAFIFFDSQNTRGKELARKDLLKVHHLRYMLDRGEFEEAKKMAKIWERDEKPQSELEAEKYNKDVLQYLFERVLGLARKGVRRELKPEELRHLDVYKEFRAEGESDILNNYNQPPLFERYEYDVESDLVRFTPRFAPFRGSYMIEGAEYLPFEVPHSIDGGLGFFLYTQKYVRLLRKLEKNEWFTMLDHLMGTGNIYLRRVYKAALLLYIDKFGERDFDRFAAYLFLMMSYYRTTGGSQDRSKQIRVESVSKYEWVKGKSWDPFEKIFIKYYPEHLVKDMHKYLLFETSENIFSNNKLGNESLHFRDAYKYKKSNKIKIVIESLLKDIW